MNNTALHTLIKNTLDTLDQTHTNNYNTWAADTNPATAKHPPQPITNLTRAQALTSALTITTQQLHIIAQTIDPEPWTLTETQYFEQNQYNPQIRESMVRSIQHQNTRKNQSLTTARKALQNAGIPTPS